MKKILLYIILFLSGIDGAWALPIEKEGMSIYSPSLKQEVSYAIILPEGYEHSDTEYPVFRESHRIFDSRFCPVLRTDGGETLCPSARYL